MKTLTGKEFAKLLEQRGRLLKGSMEAITSIKIIQRQKSSHFLFTKMKI